MLVHSQEPSLSYASKTGPDTPPVWKANLEEVGELIYTAKIRTTLDKMSAFTQIPQRQVKVL